MLTILSITAPIFLLILIGFVSTRGGIIPREALPGMSRFVLYLALPVLMFQKISQLDISQIIDLDYILVYAAGGLFSFVSVFAISRWMLKDSISFSGLKGFGSACPNSAFIGLPVMLQYFVDDAPTQAFAMVLIVENIILFPVAFALMETQGEAGSGLRKVVKTVISRLAKNPIIIAVLLGVLAVLTGFHAPGFLGRGMDLLAGAAAPVALIIIGGSLAGVAFSATFKDILMISGFKLLLQPLLVLCLVIFVVPDMDLVLKQAAVIFSASPMLSIYPIVGGQYGQQSYCSGVLMVTTILAFFSISIVLSLLYLI
ncbi:AEC family transporter [Amphritea japonica]|uniref:Auxin efflux carrier n=1 Tax=Amphritea japonica ATCC BAA-1530 TaxID=1278309 RepID=A0A7R6PF45_9GAMM|nr:AEC family transporter [Amphritea japonica]BBB27101.1 auxin efflux carrier [Amphritea japonica ATCC BAA-1530]